jgi:glyoxylate reductase
MKKVFITANLPGKSVGDLKRDYNVEVFSEERSPTEEEIIRGARDAHALVTMVTDRIDRTVIDSCPSLIVISNCGVGYENIDVAYATKRGIFVTNTPGVLTETTADLAWALIFSVARRIIAGDSFVREGRFVGWRPTLFLGVDVHGKTLGIYGMGRIGTAIAKRAKGFDMRVIYHNRKRNEESEKESGATYVDFPTLLRESDFVAIAAPLNEDSRGRFGLDEFRQMKRTAVLVNVGRGQIVKEKELSLALEERIIWGAGLDVYEREPGVEEELLKLRNVVLLPHLGSASLETRERMARMAIESAVSLLRGEIPQNLVNPEVIKVKGGKKNLSQ